MLNDKINTFSSPIDDSSVDYISDDNFNGGINFELYFDQKLYEAPKFVVDFERKSYE